MALDINKSILTQSSNISSAHRNDPNYVKIYNGLIAVSDSTFDDYMQSGRTDPVCVATALYETQPSNQSQLEQQNKIQFDTSESRKIIIKSQPREKFRPRTEKEAKESSHYIRCKDGSEYDYPTIHILRIWMLFKNIIEVTLVGIDKQPHPYTLENKAREKSSLIFKEEDLNSLYFHVTEDDIKKGTKSFMIEYIKCKQNDEITKDLIRTRQLDQSMLRFTRYYQTDNNLYQKDEDSVEYSSIMIEDYGGYSVEDVFPLYGPMCVAQKICVETKGKFPNDWKTDLTISITGDGINAPLQINNIKKNGNIFTFHMPTILNPTTDLMQVNIIIEYKQELSLRCTYVYIKKIDEQLGRVSVHQPSTTIGAESSSMDTNDDLSRALTDWSFTNDCNVPDFA